MVIGLSLSVCVPAGALSRVQSGSESVPVGVLGVTATAPATAPDTTRFTIIVDGHAKGERRMWQEAADTWRLDTLVVGPANCAAVYPVHDVGVAARALLRRSDHSLPLLPAGEARLEVLEERNVDVAGRTRRIHHYAVHGLDFRPVYVWLDEDGATFREAARQPASALDSQPRERP
jgi:hypothetical protein